MTSPDSSTPPSSALHDDGRTPSSAPTSPGTSTLHPSIQAHASALQSAMQYLAQTMADLGDGAEHLTCVEVESICDVLILTGHTDAAHALREGHAGGDEDPGDAHHMHWHELARHDEATIEACCGYDPSDDLTNQIKEG